jgi:FG-GAP-like repeat/WD40-like Beta Propeller Repeat
MEKGITGFTRNSKATVFAITLSACLSAQIFSARGQILYVAFNGNVTQLRLVNADGTGDTALATPFSNASFPAWSRDRGLLAVTATDPARPSQITLNAFTFDPVTHAIKNITNFQDNSNAGKYTTTFAYHKAFSPDRQFIAVNSIINSGGGGSSTDTPILQIFRADGSSGSLATVHVGLNKDGIHHDGEGVSWSPTQNVLALPVKWDAPLQSGGCCGEATAIFIAQPVTNGGSARQLTFPHADSDFQSYTYAEHDYQPRFSPDGTAVAYVRSFQIAYVANGGIPSPNVESLHIINANTGADTEVLRLAQGQYIEAIDWSPDGTQLVFDAGQQASSSDIPAQVVQPGTDKIFVVNINGSGLRRLAGAGSGEPAWAPGGAAGHRGDFNGDGWPDYALLDPSNHTTALWSLQNNVLKGGAYGPTLPAGWTLACIADVDVNGKLDYVLFNPATRQTAIWYLSGSFGNVLDHGALGPSLQPGWALIAVADMDQDGKPDYVLFNPTTRQTAVWFLNGTALKGGAFGPTLPAGWNLIDVNDFDANSKPDFVLFNGSSRQSAIWYLNGTALDHGVLGPSLSAGWTLQGTADFDRDGKPDFLLEESSTRRTAIWYLDGALLRTGAFGPTLPTGYSLVSP